MARAHFLTVTDHLPLVVEIQHSLLAAALEHFHLIENGDKFLRVQN